jgi:protein gp37
MAKNTSIEWTDATWNPIVARDVETGKLGWYCEKVSPACTHCYAEAINRRNLTRGTGHSYAAASRDRVKIEIDSATLRKPLHWKKPRRIFVCSMTDLFGEFVPFELIDQVFSVAAICPQHTFQVLTKRPERMEQYLSSALRYTGGEPLQLAFEYQWDHLAGARDARRWDEPAWPLANVHVGCTVENQTQASRRLPSLLRCPAAVRFVSYEPALGPVDFTRVTQVLPSGGIVKGSVLGNTDGRTFSPRGAKGEGINWVIGGCESGPKRRPSEPQWFRHVRDQCAAAGVAYFQKQLEINGRVSHNPSDWPAPLRVREFPTNGGEHRDIVAPWVPQVGDTVRGGQSETRMDRVGCRHG